MDGLILPGGNPGVIPPEFQGNLQAVPIIPQAVKDAQKAFIEEGYSLLEAIEDQLNPDSKAGPDFSRDEVIFKALKWIIKGQLPLKM